MSEFTPGPWDLLEVGDKCKHLCPSHDNLSILTVSLEYNNDDGEPQDYGVYYDEAGLDIMCYYTLDEYLGGAI